MRRLKKTWLLVAVLALAVPAVADLVYRGFTVEDTALQGRPELAPLLAATREQIDLVHAVGLPDPVLAFMQGVPLELVPRSTFKRPTPGLYTTKDRRRVQLSPGLVRIGPRPVLLHELIHALHDRQLPQGFRNPSILDLYRQARSIPAFAAKSHMLANASEYFACTATAFLFGVTAQEPFSRDKLRQHQPACLDHLQSLFGPAAGHYQGSLTDFPAGRDNPGA